MEVICTAKMYSNCRTKKHDNRLKPPVGQTFQTQRKGGGKPVRGGGGELVRPCMNRHNCSRHPKPSNFRFFVLGVFLILADNFYTMTNKGSRT